MGAQVTVLIKEVSLFQSVHNSRFDCITMARQCLPDPGGYDRLAGKQFYASEDS